MSKKRKSRLVVQHLEKVSGKVLVDYPDIIREMIRGKSGVYALYRRDSLYYVGLATNLMARLKQHLRDRHHRQWDRFSVYLTFQEEHIKELESLLLRIASPAGNKQQGKFAASKSLFRDLHRRIREHDSERRAELLGGHLKRNRARRRVKKARDYKSVFAVVGRRMRLRREYKGWIYQATLLKDGTVRYGDYIYETPTAVAHEIAGRHVNGWYFWRYRNEDGEWVPLKRLREEV